MNKLIRDYIKDNGIRFTFVADRAEINVKKFSRLMLGNQKLSLEEYEAICEKGLNVSPTFFYENKFQKNTNSA